MSVAPSKSKKTTLPQLKETKKIEDQVSTLSLGMDFFSGTPPTTKTSGIVEKTKNAIETATKTTTLPATADPDIQKALSPNKKADIDEGLAEIIGIKKPQEDISVVEQNKSIVKSILTGTNALKKTEKDGVPKPDTDTADNATGKLYANTLLKWGLYAQTAGAVASMAGYYQNYKNVKKLSGQYNTQKKIIDANIDTTEARMMDNFTTTIQQAEAMYASQNVDIRSGAMTTLKEQGLENLQKDFASLEQNAKLQKASLDLDYAMKRRDAANQMSAGILSGALDITTSFMKYWG